MIYQYRTYMQSPNIIPAKLIFYFSYKEKSLPHSYIQYRIADQTYKLKIYNMIYNMKAMAYLGYAANYRGRSHMHCYGDVSLLDAWNYQKNSGADYRMGWDRQRIYKRYGRYDFRQLRKCKEVSGREEVNIVQGSSGLG